jgi:hypothetical protein
VKALARIQQGFNDRLFALNPNYGKMHRDIVFDWHEFRKYVRFRHIYKAVILVIMALSIHFTLSNMLPWARNTVISSIAGGLNFSLQFLFQTDADFTFFTTIVVIAVFLLSFRYVDSYYWKLGELDDGFSQVAMREEIVFRKGSERWNLQQKAASCFSFGALHVGTLIVPFTAVVTLTFMGAAFMYIYHRAYQKHHSQRLSLKESAAVHMAYNIIVVCFLGTVVVILVVLLILSLIFE